MRVKHNKTASGPHIGKKFRRLNCLSIINYGKCSKICGWLTFNNNSDNDKYTDSDIDNDNDDDNDKCNDNDTNIDNNNDNGNDNDKRLFVYYQCEI